MGGKEVEGGGKWRGGRELRGEGGGAMQEGRELRNTHAATLC